MKNPTWPKSLSGNFLREANPEFVATVESERMKSIDRNSTITLEAVTKESVRAVSLLDVGPGQDGLVAPNAFSIAQAYFAPAAWFRAVCADGVPVGFAMMEDGSLVNDVTPELYEGAPYVSLWRFMIDHRFQKLGFGAAAMTLLIAHAKTRPAAVNMLLSFVPKEKNPEGFYQRFGFTRTGEIEHGEVVMKLALR